MRIIVITIIRIFVITIIRISLKSPLAMYTH